MKSMKGQSAMEYLMTYGWAILIIAIVLVALFELGIFGGSTLPTACVAQSGFICSSPSFVGGNIIVTVGQSSGQTFSGASVFFEGPAALSTFSSSPSTPTANVVSIGTMVSGATDTVTIPLSSSVSTAVGTGLSGQLWIAYTTTGTSTTQYQELATITAKET